MAFFTVAGVTIPVAQDSASAEIKEVGDRGRSFDGTLRETIRSRYSVYSGATIPMDRNTATTVLNALNNASQPRTCGGDMLSTGGGTFSMFTRATKRSLMQTGSTSGVVISWTAEDA